MNEVRMNKARIYILEGTGVNGYALPFLTPRPSEPHWTCPVWFFIGANRGQPDYSPLLNGVTRGDI